MNKSEYIPKIDDLIFWYCYGYQEGFAYVKEIIDNEHLIIQHLDEDEPKRAHIRNCRPATIEDFGNYFSNDRLVWIVEHKKKMKFYLLNERVTEFDGSPFEEIGSISKNIWNILNCDVIVVPKDIWDKLKY